MAVNAGSVYAELVLDTSKFDQGLQKAQKQMDDFSKKLESVGKNMEKAGEKLNKYVTAPVVAMGTLSAKAAIDFESAFAGVRKTVDATEEEFAALEKGIRDMSKEIPASAAVIAGVAEAAGQLGIETENILEFTRVMIDLGEATNLSAEEAATSLARFANITQMSQKDFDRLGSTIVELGNNLATTEAEIAAMALRLAGAGSQVGLTEAQIMSFAAALSSVGMEAEAGGTAFSRVMVDMQLAVETNSERLKVFAEVAGMSAEEFRRAFQEDAAGAIIAFIQGLATAEDRGLSAIKVLDDMGISEIRLRDALLRAAGASNVFTDALEMGTQAWEENTALTKEAEQRYQTTASQLQIAKNHLQDTAITIGEIMVPHLVNFAEKIKNLAEWFKNLNPETQETIVKMAGLAAAIGPLLIITGKLSQGIGSTIEVGKKLIDNWDNIKKVGGILSSGLNSTVGFIFSPAGAIIAGIAATIAIGVALYKNWDTIKEKAGELKNKIGEAWDNIKTKTSETWDNIKTAINEKWENIKENTNTTLQNIRKNTSDKWEEIKKNTSEKWEQIKSNVSTKWSNIKTNTSTTLQEIRNNMTSKWEEIRTNTSEKWASIKENIFEKARDIKEKIISSITESESEWNSKTADMEATKSRFSNLASKVTDAFGKIAGAIRGAVDAILDWNRTEPKDKTATYTTTHQTVYETIGGGPRGGGRAISAYARGTNYHPGGLAWVGEQGPELIELPKGTKVYSNQKSMEMVRGASGGIIQNIHIHSPEPLSPSEVARKNLQVSRQLAMEWGL